MISRKPNDSQWFDGGLYHDNMSFGVPSFWFVSWYDVSVAPNIALFNHVRENGKNDFVRENQYLVIAPTLHCGFTRATKNTIVGERSMGDARLDYDKLIYGWFDFLLKNEANDFKEKTPRVQYFTMGINSWQTSENWPPKNTFLKTFYLNSNGKANSRFGDGKLTSSIDRNGIQVDSFYYDPMDPVVSYGGGVCCTGNAVQGGSFDQRKMEEREDILVYTSDVFKKGIEMTGFIESTLYISSDVKDTDLTIKIIDVYPDGTAYNLEETIQRVRYREGYDKEVFMDKDKVYKVDLTPMATSNYFKKGHRIRIEVSSSNFPRFSRNLNTGGDNYDETKSIIALNKIHHSKRYPSNIKLPFISK
jgi:putative CocE/NonD family hydrolase